MRSLVDGMTFIGPPTFRQYFKVWFTLSRCFHLQRPLRDKRSISCASKKTQVYSLHKCFDCGQVEESSQRQAN